MVGSVAGELLENGLLNKGDIPTLMIDPAAVESVEEIWVK